MKKLESFIVMLNGASKSGKDTFYEAVKDRAVRLAFADQLKEFCLTHFGTPVEKFKDEAAALVQRDVWIKLGQAGRIATEGKIWAEAVSLQLSRHFKFAEYATNPVKPVIITDCGFDNEYEYIRDKFGASNVFVVHISRPDNENKNDGAHKG